MEDFPNSYVHRLKVLEQKFEVVMRETNGALGQLATSIEQIVKVHRMFTAYVDENLTELKKHTGFVNPAVEAVELAEGGKEL